MKAHWLAALLLGSIAAPVCSQIVMKAEGPPGLKALPFATHGRAVSQPNGDILRQWPGTYFETAFAGPSIYFRVGPGEVSLRVSIDGEAPVALVKPVPGSYRVSAGGSGVHRVRIDVVSESQREPTIFGGFFAPPSTHAAPLPHRTHAIEFIGDSHTVGFGNTSEARRHCTQSEVWATTDTSQGIPALVARHINADYQVNAISGRGIVRNYDGFAAPTLPEAYPFALLDRSARADALHWRPQVLILSLGTNDFSTPLHDGERWANRDALHADYEATFLRFVRMLRARHPHAYLLFWATDLGGDEIETEVARVVDQLHASGDRRVGYEPMNGLRFGGCDSHPDLADDRTIANRLIAHIDGVADVWKQP
ncbi:GDSL family lipase [Sphingomonas sp. AP4-R1]|uniref:SGNH/GDSL hydrolase family protein n=1 Tax=Sphingomonas sp. AP4-R1 TaxID=2735134 RepID=UPI0014936D7A|nr:SGNH/GDSL hydrolase family protein [Sphingomonas sp. AP4-R1]QJU59060.1 GDSL family lipase [Sphingomonas sp. AP4-R1]